MQEKGVIVQQKVQLDTQENGTQTHSHKHTNTQIEQQLIYMRHNLYLLQKARANGMCGNGDCTSSSAGGGSRKVVQAGKGRQTCMPNINAGPHHPHASWVPWGDGERFPCAARVCTLLEPVISFELISNGFCALELSSSSSSSCVV